MSDQLILVERAVLRAGLNHEGILNATGPDEVFRFGVRRISLTLLRRTDKVGPMRLAFAAISAALDQATMRIGSILIANLLAALLSLPLLLLAVALGVIAGSLEIVILTAVLLIVVLPNPAAAGIHFLVHGFAHQDALLGAADSRYGLRMYAGLACHLWLIGIAGTLVILGNLAFYLTLHMVMGLFCGCYGSTC
jgi:hypothetical protein